LGLTPQSINQLSGYKVQGKTREAALRLVKDAELLDQAGAFAIVLETIPTPLARIITQRVKVPTIGIGAGPYCDGQVQVIHDMLGLFTDFVPKHAKRYAQLGDVIQKSVRAYIDEVKTEAFPTEKESFTMDKELAAELEAELAR
ncbi:MAG: 3-methyl-2-oxobutanoate hydroxymethyltransferase, partial [Chloroflexi bacterium]|nr:3-methyl-2-oxobutanoate hydroxymethyltransferase [Chloroflexota bacterium]